MVALEDAGGGGGSSAGALEVLTSVRQSRRLVLLLVVVMAMMTVMRVIRNGVIEDGHASAGAHSGRGGQINGHYCSADNTTQHTTTPMKGTRLCFG